jgi:hypothetical protein
MALGRNSQPQRRARAGIRNSPELLAADDPQVGPVLFCLQDRRLPLTGQVLEGVSVQERLVELPALEVAHIAERRIADYLLDAAVSAALAMDGA